MADKLKVFISTVSAQFKDCRDALASDPRAIGCEVKVQEDFQQGADTLIAQIESYIIRQFRSALPFSITRWLGYERAPIASL